MRRNNNTTMIMESECLKINSCDLLYVLVSNVFRLCNLVVHEDNMQIPVPIPSPVGPVNVLCSTARVSVAVLDNHFMDLSHIPIRSLMPN